MFTKKPQQKTELDEVIDDGFIALAAVHANGVFQMLSHAQVVIQHRCIGKP